MDRLGALILTLAAAAFAGSLMRFGAAPHLLAAARPETAADGVVMMGGFLTLGAMPSGGSETLPLSLLSLQMIQRSETIPWLLTMAVCMAIGIHVLRAVAAQWRAEQAAAARATRQAAFLRAGDVGPWPPAQIAALHARNTRFTEIAPLVIALLAGAVWPWLSLHSAAWGFAAAGVAMIAALSAAIRGQGEGTRIRHSAAVGLLAGWATAIAMSAFVGVLSAGSGVSDTLAALVALGLTGSIGTWVQWRLGRPIAYAMGLIWALVGVAILTMDDHAMVAMAAILAIAALAVTVVRGAS